MPVEPPFTGQHLLFTFSGTLPSGEIWSLGLRTVVGSSSLPALTSYAPAAASAFRTWWNSTQGPGTFNPPAVHFTHVTVRQISTAGKTEYAADFDYGTSVPGQGATLSAPNQTALVVTTLTGLSGRSNRGRFYLPWLSPILEQTTGRNRLVDLTALASGCVTFLNAISALTYTAGGGTDPALPLAIQSRVAGQGGHRIVSIKIGDVCDTQRRRRDKELENYVSAAL